MRRLKDQVLPIDGLRLIERVPFSDSRGSLARLFCSNELANVGWTGPIAQVNHAFTKTRGTIRGLHYQLAPYSELKIVSCIRGIIWDVAIDLRAGSSSFLKWHAEVLSADNNRSILIPKGFAHGFQALSDNVELIYCHSECYMPEQEAGLNPQDPRLSISWPLPIAELSTRDHQSPFIDSGFKGVPL